MDERRRFLEDEAATLLLGVDGGRDDCLGGLVSALGVDGRRGSCWGGLVPALGVDVSIRCLLHKTVIIASLLW